MRIDDGGGFADIDGRGNTEIRLEPRADGKIHLSITTTHHNRSAIGVPLDSAAARDLCGRLIAYAILLDEEDD